VWDRYAYTPNNPLKYTDPTGHKACGDGTDTNCSNGHGQDPITNKPKTPNVGTGCGGRYAEKCDGSPKHVLEQAEHIDQPTQLPGIAVQTEYLIYSYIKDYNKMSPVLWRKTFTLGKAINPFPGVDALIGAAGQGLTDSFNPNLSPLQRGERLAVAFGESLLTGYASDAIGAGVALAGGGPGGYAAAQVISSIAIDNGFWATYNHKNFGAAGY
jgi:hypothetical protein